MQLGLEIMLAARYLRARKANGIVSALTIFSFLGIFLGVATLIIVMAVMEGFQTQLTNRIVGLNGHAVLHYVDADPQKLSALQKKIEGLNHVTKTVPVQEGQALISHSGRMKGAIIRGMPAQSMIDLSLLSEGLKVGQAVQEGSRQVMIGVRLAEELGVQVGGAITLTSPQGAFTPFGQIPKVERFEVGGIFKVGMTEYDSAYVFMDLPLAQDFFQAKQRITGLEIFIDQPDLSQNIVSAILTNKWGASATTWQESNAAFFAALAVERTMMFIILSLIILVAALNIISGMSMLVRDKAAEIAVLRGMGMSRMAVMRIFIMAGSSIGVVGTVAGVGLALVFCAYIDEIKNIVSSLLGVPLFDPSVYFLASLPADVQLDDILLTVGMSFILTLLATVVPAWRASSLPPAEALRRG